MIKDNIKSNIVAVGLKEDQEFIADFVKEKDKKTYEQLQEMVSKRAYRLEGEDLFSMDISTDKGNEIGVIMSCPDELDFNKPIIAIHFMEDGSADIIPVERIEIDHESKITFKTNCSGQFFFGNARIM